jgi:hypothetical protein
MENCRCWWWDWIAGAFSCDHTCSLWIRVIPVLDKNGSYQNETFTLNVGCSVDCRKIHWHNSRLAAASCGTNSCTDWRWWGYNCCLCNVRRTDLYELEEFWYWHKTLLQQPQGSALPSAHYVQNVESQYPIAIRKMFPPLGVGGQQTGKNDDLAHSNWGVFPCIF